MRPDLGRRVRAVRTVEAVVGVTLFMGGTQRVAECAAPRGRGSS